MKLILGPLFLFLASHLGVSAEHDIEWSTLEEQMKMKVSDMSATYVPEADGIIIAGGCSDIKGNQLVGQDSYQCTEITDKVYLFNPESKAFMILPKLPTPRYRHAAIAINGNLFVVGGRTLDDSLIAQIDVYNAKNEEWLTWMDIPAEYLTSDNAVVTYNDNLYILGGWDQNYTAHNFIIEIDVGTKKVSQKSNMLTARGDAHAVTYTHESGKTVAYILGGFTDANAYCEPLEEAEMYDFVEDKWKSVASLNQKRGDKALVVLNNRVLAIAGESKHSSKCTGTRMLENGEGSGSIILDDVESFDPRQENPVWTIESDLPELRYRMAAAVVEPRSELYVFGGQSPYLDDCQCYPTTDSIFMFYEKNPHFDSANRVKGTVFATFLVFVAFATMLFV